MEIVAPGQVRLAEEPSPEPDSSMVRIRVAYCGICTSDLVRIASQADESPRVGHEIAGTVESAPPGSGLRPGDLVVGVGNGGYASEVDLDPGHVLAIPSGLSLLDASLAEPLACALLAVEHLDLMHADRVCVVGSGFIGLLVVRALVLKGVDVAVIEPRESARRLAVEMGASCAWAPTTDDPEGDRDVQVVVECTGTEGGLDVATRIIAGGGQLGIVGWHRGDRGLRQIDMAAWNANALRVTNLHGRSIDHHMLFVRRALALLAAGHIDTTQLITSTVALARFPQWLGEPRDPASVKAVLDCRPAEAR